MQEASHSSGVDAWAVIAAAFKIVLGLMLGAALAIALGPGWETFLQGSDPWATTARAFLAQASDVYEVIRHVGAQWIREVMG
jgi:hypothetical protein